MSLPRTHTTRGFTLIELLVVLAVVAILIAIALPNYSRSIIKGNRGEAHTGLQRLQLMQEDFRSQNNGYSDGDDTAMAAQLAGLSKPDLYNYEITDSGPLGYTATATATGRQATGENRHYGATCTTLTVTVARTGVRRTPTECW